MSTRSSEHDVLGVASSKACFVTVACVLGAAAACVAADDPAKSGEALDAARKSEDVAVVSLSKQMLTQEQGGAGYDCRRWLLTAADVKFFFRRAIAIDSELIHLSYYTLPCNYRGSIRMAGTVYTFEINGGSYGTLGNAPLTPAQYGCKQPCTSFFPAIYDDEK